MSDPLERRRAELFHYKGIVDRKQPASAPGCLPSSSIGSLRSIVLTTVCVKCPSFAFAESYAFHKVGTKLTFRPQRSVRSLRHARGFIAVAGKPVTRWSRRSRESMSLKETTVRRLSRKDFPNSSLGKWTDLESLILHRQYNVCRATSDRCERRSLQQSFAEVENHVACVFSGHWVLSDAVGGRNASAVETVNLKIREKPPAPVSPFDIDAQGRRSETTHPAALGAVELVVDRRA